MPCVTILGAGMIGTTMASDLSRERDIDVTVVDLDRGRLSHAAEHVRRLTNREVEVRHADLSDPAQVAGLVQGVDLVLGALPGTVGYRTLHAVIEARRNYVDISFMPENPLALDDLARQRGVTAVVDCGVAPGLSNLLAGWAVHRLQRVDEIEILVGGVPVERRWPFQYKAAFSPADVIEEYTRPARLVEHGRIVTRPALSEPKLVDFAGVGTLEAFNTDGLRTLLDTLHVPAMREMTLRYPGHIELMRVFREVGLFSREPLDLPNLVVRPLDVTSALLFPLWSYQEGEADLTVMRVRATGIDRGGKATELRWELHDRYDHTTRQSSMSRTTAFPATIIARAILSGRIGRQGVIPPELLAGDEAIVRSVLAELGRRQVHVEEHVG